jgi:NADPH-dependent glutamate synthase beta subunit-like oxidoreductase
MVELKTKSHRGFYIAVPSVSYGSKPMSIIKPVSWRVLTPVYVTKLAPCMTDCPAGTDVRLFVRLSSEKKFIDAYKTIYQSNPFPSTCGRVCPHFCQQNCNRNRLDESLNIGAIERFLGDYGLKNDVKPHKIKFSEKIAVIGSGPAGLTAALRLRQKGYRTTVYEALSQTGGMMRVGIPEFRLPQNILDEEINMIVRQGVEIILNKKVTIQEIEKDYSVIIVAIGSHMGTRMNIANENLALEGIKFLHDFKMNNNRQSISKGDRVAVIGGGNTAIDVARTILRLGGEPTIYYRRTRKEMPAIPHEIEEAQAEAVKIEFLTVPVNLEKDESGRINVMMRKMKLGKPDETGRRRPVPVKGSEKPIKVGKIITAIGQKYDDFVFSGKGIRPRQGKVDFPSNVPVFCCGDMAVGGTVTEAVGSGNEVAREVLAFLSGESIIRKDEEDIVWPDDINYVYYLQTYSNRNSIEKTADLYNDFSEVVQGLSEESVVGEAHRCLHCGDCYKCGNCFNQCPEATIYLDEEKRLRIDYDHCKGCGICFQECPCSAIRLKLDDVVRE